MEATGVKMAPAIRVQLLDTFGNVCTNSNVPVILTKKTGPGSITGSLKATPSNGIATFPSLMGKTAGDYVLTATAGLLTIDTVQFTIAPNVAKKLAFVQQPTTTAVNTAIIPDMTVQVLDNFGNLVTTSTASITLARSSGPAAGINPMTTAAVAGIATFSGVTPTVVGTYKLKATALSLSTTNSLAFVVHV